jgi:hypothetical protein
VRRPQPRWLSSPTQAIAAFDKSAEPWQACPLEVRLRTEFRKKLGLCSHSSWLLNRILAGIQAYDLAIVGNQNVSRLKRSLPPAQHI